MDLDPEFRARLLAVFQGELSEQLELARGALDQLDAGLEGEARKEASDSVVRVAHNLKGATRGVGIDDASEIAYDLESMMALVRDGSIPWSRGLFELCHEAFGRMSDATVAFAADRPATFDAAELSARIKAASAG